jgi:hypothetical protein
VASVALFLALSSGAYAFFQIGRNAVHAKQIAPNSVSSSEIKNKSVLLSDIAKNVNGAPAPLPRSDCPPGYVLKVQVRSFVGVVGFKCVPEFPGLPAPAPGPPPCPETEAASGDHCLPIPGLPADEGDSPPTGLPPCPNDAVPGTLCVNPSGGELPQGETVAGVLGNVGPLQSNQTYFAYASLPSQATNYLDDAAVLVNDLDDAQDRCIGNFQTPLAPEGFACIYLVRQNDVASAEGVALNGVGSKNGFSLKIQIDGSATALAGAEGSWAYTADAPDPD